MNDNDTAREKALTGAITQIERQFGKGSIMRMADGNPQLSVESIPTGSLTLDLALGIGGVPRGRVVEIYGNESSGKTTLANISSLKHKRRVVWQHLLMQNMLWI